MGVNSVARTWLTTWKWPPIFTHKQYPLHSTLVDAHSVGKREQGRCIHIHQIGFIDRKLTEPEITFIKPFTGSQAYYVATLIVLHLFFISSILLAISYLIHLYSLQKSNFGLHIFLQVVFSLFTFILFLLLVCILQSF